MERTWTYGGRAYPFDITEADCISRMTRAMARLKSDMEAWQLHCQARQGGIADGSLLAEHCANVRLFFDTLFGDGEGAAITGESDSAQECSEAYADFLCFAQMQVNRFARIREEVEERYRERLERMAAGRRETGDGNPL